MRVSMVERRAPVISTSLIPPRRILSSSVNVLIDMTPCSKCSVFRLRRDWRRMLGEIRVADYDLKASGCWRQLQNLVPFPGLLCVW